MQQAPVKLELEVVATRHPAKDIAHGGERVPGSAKPAVRRTNGTLAWMVFSASAGRMSGAKALEIAPDLRGFFCLVLLYKLTGRTTEKHPMDSLPY